MSSHTPGPWKVHQDDTFLQPPIQIVDRNGMIIAKVIERHGADDPHNAKLIASAPALLQALKDVLAYRRPFASKADGGLGLEYNSQNLDSAAWEKRQSEIESIVKSAIALAEGGI